MWYEILKQIFSLPSLSSDENMQAMLLLQGNLTYI